MIVVTLNYAEMLIAVLVAGMRRTQNLKLDTAKRSGRDDPHTVWQTEVISTLGEMGVAKHTDHFWSGAIGDYSAADVSTFYQVRASHWDNGRLLLYPKDNPGQPFILARVKDGEVTLVGWVYGREGKKEEYWGPIPNYPYANAYIVPTDLLRGMETLPTTELELAA